MPKGLRRRHRTSNATTAFTLIELLVVISIMSLLIGILLPSLGKAFRIAESGVCSSLQRQLMQGMISYSLENDDKIPGPNSSGYGILERVMDSGGCETALQYTNTRITPVQPWDWITPSLSPDSLPLGRNARFYSLFSDYRCPSMKTKVTIYPPGGGDCGSVSMEEYVFEVADDLPYGSSFLMNANWQVAGPRSGDSGWPIIRQSVYSFQTPVRMPAGYVPKIVSVGNPSIKAAFGDGFRYLTATGIVDIDGRLAPGPQQYSAFTDASPVFIRSRAYGVSQANDNTQGRNLPLSYRHEKTMNAAFFDGHVENLTQVESRDPAMWFPAGSQLTANGVNDVHESVRQKYTLGQYLH